MSIQALYTIMEKDVTIRCRKSDSDLVKKAKDEASKDFKENAGFDIKLEIAEDLPEESCVPSSPHTTQQLTRLSPSVLAVSSSKVTEIES